MEWEDLQLFSTYQLSGELRAIQDRIIVEELKTGETVTKTGIDIPDDDAKNVAFVHVGGKYTALARYKMK